MKLIERIQKPASASFIAFAVFFICITIVAFGQISYNDFFWHLSLGKWMFAAKSFLAHDIFSYTFGGRTWLNETWLFDGLIYLIYQKAGYFGLGVLRLALLLGAYFFFFKLATGHRKDLTLPAASLLLFTLPMVRNLLRPEIASPLFIGLFLYLLYQYRESRNKKILILLPVFEVIWVNTHGSFYIGPLLIGIFFTAEFIRRYSTYRNDLKNFIANAGNLWIYAGAGIATFLATLLNPYGYHIYGYIIRMLSDIDTLSTIQEWLPLSIRTLFTLPPTAVLSFVVLFWLLAALLVRNMVTWYRTSKSVGDFIGSVAYEDIFIGILFACSAFQYNRGMYIFTLIAAYTIVKNFPRKDTSWLVEIRNYSLLTVAAFFFVSTLSNLKLNIGPSEIEHPRHVAEFIKEHAIPGPMLNEYALGSDLIWLLYPEYKVFIDGRAANLYDADFYWYYNNLGNDKIFKLFDERYGFNFAVFPNGGAFAKKLADSPDWQLVFFDNAASLYVKKVPQNESLIESNRYIALNPSWDLEKYRAFCKNDESKKILLNELSRNIKDVPSSIPATLVLANISIWCPDEGTDALLPGIETLLKSALEIQPSNNALITALGATQLNLDKPKAAYATFRKALRLEKSKNNFTGIGTALFNLGKYKQAARELKKVPAATGQEPNSYYQIYGRVLYHIDDNLRAISMLQRFLSLAQASEISASDYLYLSKAYQDAGNSSEANINLQKAKELDPDSSLDSE